MLDKIVNAGTWAWTNRAEIVAALAAVIAGASVLIKAVEGAVKILVTVFPVLITVDGKLLSVASWLDAFSKSSILNTIAGSPTVAFKAILNPPGTLISAHAQAVAAVAPQPAPSLAGVLTPPAKGGFVRVVASVGLTLLCLAASLISCTHVSPVVTQLLDCGESAVQKQLPAILSTVNGILQGSNINWQDQLNTLLVTAGDVVICAVQVAVSDLEHSAAPSQLTYVAIARGEAWLVNHPTTVAAAKP